MSGYGSGQVGNRVYFNLKVKRGTEIDPHIEVRKSNGTKYEVVDDKCSYVEGKFAGIDYGTYKVKDTVKNKIEVTLVNTVTNEVYVIQAAMNSHARSIMLCMCSLFGSLKESIETINISVYQKNGFSEISIKHNGEYAKWYMPWEEQKALHGKKDDYIDYSKLEEVLLLKWKKAKAFIDGLGVYKTLLESVVGVDQTEPAQAAPTAAATANVMHGAPAQTQEPENLNGDVEDPLDDLPF